MFGRVVSNLEVFREHFTSVRTRSSDASKFLNVYEAYVDELFILKNLTIMNLVDFTNFVDRSVTVSSVSRLMCHQVTEQLSCHFKDRIL